MIVDPYMGGWLNEPVERAERVRRAIFVLSILAALASSVIAFFTGLEVTNCGGTAGTGAAFDVARVLIALSGVGAAISLIWWTAQRRHDRGAVSIAAALALVAIVGLCPIVNGAVIPNDQAPAGCGP